MSWAAACVPLRPWRARIGRRAERCAERFLKAKGLRVLARNYARRTGEIDLVMLDGETLVFVEVRYRGGGRLADRPRIRGPRQAGTAGAHCEPVPERPPATSLPRRTV